MELKKETIDYLAKVTPGYVAIYRVNGSVVETLYHSPDLPEQNGMSQEEYDRLTAGNASTIVLSEDLPGLMNAIRRSIGIGDPLDYHYRVIHKTQGFDWVHARARICGELNGCPVFLATYVNASVETDIYRKILNGTDRMIYICDSKTRKLLYANETAIKRRKSVSGDFAGSTCYSYMQGRDTPCESCVLNRRQGTPLLEKRFDADRNIWECITGEFANWCGHDAFVHYVSDITEREKHELELRNILDSEDNLVKNIQILNGTGAIDSRLSSVMKNIGEYFEADRAYIFAVNKSEETLSNTYEWCREGVKPQIAFLQNGDIHYIDRWLPFFKKKACVIIPDIEKIRESNSNEYNIMAMQEIRSYMEAPIFMDDKLYGFLGVDNPSAEKVLHSGDLLLSLAYSLSNVLIREKSERQLSSAKRRYELAVKGAGLGVWEYHIAERTITSPGESFKKFGIAGKIQNVPESILPLFIDKEKPRLLEMFTKIDNGIPKITEDFWMRWTPDSPLRCERVIYSTVKDAQGIPTIAYAIGMDVTQQKQEEERFHQSMQELLAVNPDALGTLQVNLSRNLCGEGHENSPVVKESLHSQTVDELICSVSTHISDIRERNKFLREFNREKMLEAFKNGKNTLCEEYHRCGAEGLPFWIRTYVNMLKNPETGDIEGVLYSLDISREKQREGILNIITNQEFEFVAVLHCRAEMIEAFYLGKSLPEAYHALFAHPGSLCSIAKVRKHVLSTWVYPEDHEKYKEVTDLAHLRKELDEHGHYEITIRGTSPEHPEKIVFRKLQHYYLDDTHDSVLILNSDVTGTYHQQQRELEYVKTETKRVQDILDYISSGVCVLVMPDPDHLIIEYSNKQMPRLLGFDEGVQKSKDITRNSEKGILEYFTNAFSGVHPEDLARVQAAYKAGYSQKQFTVPNFRLMTNSRDYIWVTVDAVLREVSEKGKIFYGTYRNVTEEIRLQDRISEQLEAEQKLRRQATAASTAKTDFLSRMSHDIRTPLNGIIGMSRIAKEQKENPEKTKDCLKKIDTSSKFLLGLVNDILDMSKAESNKIALRKAPYVFMDFSNYLDAVIKPLCMDKNQKLVIDTRICMDAVPLMDSLRINQIYFNLLSNATKYTPEGGTITFKVREHITSENKLAIDSWIIDNGIGMSTKFQKILFEPFTQEDRDDSSEARGSGLGLAIVKKMVDLMGGTISVKSEIGKGTTFIFSAVFDFIPAKALPAKNAEEDNADDLASLANKRILLCEDHPLNQEIIKALLVEKNMFLEVADDGARGVEVFNRSPINFYDAVLMDIRMPIMNGYDATKAIRALRRDDAGSVPIIAMTADAFDDDVQKCLAAGMNGHIAKPVEPEKLFLALKKFIR